MALDHFNVTRNTTKTVLNSQGVLETVPPNVPAFEFNPDGSYKGCLIEPSATNLRYTSDYFQSWDIFARIVQESSSLGSMYRKLIPTDDNDSHLTGHLTGQSGTHTFSVIAKADEFKFIRLRWFNSTEGSRNITVFDLENGVVDSGNGKITDYGGGKYKCEVTATSTVDDRATIDIINNDKEINFAGDNVSGLIIGFPMIEEGEVSTSFAEGTRNADVIERKNASDLIGQDEGTVFVEVIRRDAGRTLSERLISLSDNSSIEFQLRMSAVTPETVLCSYKGSNFGFTNIGTDSISKLALTYKSGEQKFYINGNLVGSLSNEDSLTINEITIGASPTSTLQFNDHIRSVALYKHALTQQEAEALTS